MRFRQIRFAAGILLLAVMWSPLQAQDTSGTRNFKGVISSYPLNFVVSSLKLGYEFKLKENLNLKTIGNVLSAGDSWYYNAQSVLAFGLEVQPRFYTHQFKNDFHGFYLAPFAMYNTATFNAQVVETVSYQGYQVQYIVYKPKSVGAFSAGGVMGFQLISNSHIGFDFYLGGGYNHHWGYDYYFDEADSPYKGGITPHIGLAVCVGL